MFKLKYVVFLLGMSLLSFSSQAMVDDEHIESSQSSMRQRFPIVQEEENPRERDMDHLLSPVAARNNDFDETSYYRIITRKLQNWSYQFLATTIWDPIMSGFKPARIRAMDLLDLNQGDCILLVGEGSGLDLEVLPEIVAKEKVWALDYSSRMVAQAKLRAEAMEIPQENCIIGDAQKLPFDNEQFNKLFFPLSLGSIPNPMLALQEAERVLTPGGKIVILEKLVDDGETISYFRHIVNFFTKFIFADINRNLTHIMGIDSPLKIIHYESLRGKLDGYVTGMIAPYYRLAVLVRQEDYPGIEPCRAIVQ